ncbi:hypothetical protein [Ancylobacter mangrovi]|uniref:Phosphate starvation-inducible protein PsiF n=1 Tax=Ancylobacter mangrovi TaxID=2972472 RepID=A0A9X2PEV4_9HYPH|nr:hypothetical protein [Ancylobacter mangrovi]MCS0496630.1 hypothetical protein [Ancylobacter mangrovi]MCS0505288.1 hypothetical protein [Ancylobacter mangrovi]
MTKRLLAGLTAATFVLASASAFAASSGTAPAGAAPAATATHASATPEKPKTSKVAVSKQQKSCEKEWSVDHKAGKLKGVTQKDFISKCMKGA